MSLRSKLFLFLGLTLSAYLFFSSNLPYVFFNTNHDVFDVVLLVSHALSVLFFLPIIVFFELGIFFRNGGDIDYVPTFWYFITFVVGLAYSFYLSISFTDPSKSYAAIWTHAILASTYLFLLGSLIIFWHFNYSAIWASTPRRTFISIIGPLLSYSLSLGIILFFRKKLGDNKQRK